MGIYWIIAFTKPVFCHKSKCFLNLMLIGKIEFQKTLLEYKAIPIEIGLELHV